MRSGDDHVSLLTQVTRAIVPAFADGATADMLDANGKIQRLAITHLDTEKEALLRAIRQRFPLDLHDEHPLANVLRTGQAEIVAEITVPLFADMRDEKDYLDLVCLLELRSFMCVPLIARNRVVGALTFVATSAERRFSPTDLVVAKDLALRVALAVDNLRLYQEAQQEIIARTQMAQRVREYSAHLERQRQELEEVNIQLGVQVSTDGLTGLNNHLAFQEALAKEVQRAQRYQAPLSLLLLDVDHFKQYNDTYGHPAGDQVLKQVGGILRTSARATDFIARYGGEEFVAILPDTDAAGALEVAERLRQGVEATSGFQRTVTASFGAATLTSCVTCASDLIAWADKALYAAKHGGRNRAAHADSFVNGSLGEAAEALVPVPDRRSLSRNHQEKTPSQWALSYSAPAVPTTYITPAELAQAYDATVEGWSRLLDLRDKETEGHSQRVTELTLHLARRMGVNEAELAYIRWGVLLHDIGKIGGPDSILLKPGPLTETEWEIMRRHPVYAYEMLSPIRFLRHAVDIPYSHHEKWDGSGYPQGLLGAEIPMAARLFAVVDVWDVVRSDRPYRPGWPEEQACAYLRSQAGIHFDPTIVETFLSLWSAPLEPIRAAVETNSKNSPGDRSHHLCQTSYLPLT